MNTITINPVLYHGAERYAKEHNVSIRELVENFISKLITVRNEDASINVTEMNKDRYIISPRLKSVELRHKVDTDDLSLDYKKEIHDIRDSKYL